MARIGTNFKTDMETYGKIGEVFLFEQLEKSVASGKYCRIIDTSNKKEYSFFDIDFIGIKSPNVTDEEVLSILQGRNILNPEIAVAFEIKTDTQTLFTKNFVFEMMSHNNPGCLLRTLSNYIVYFCLDNQNQIVEYYVIETPVLKQWVFNHFKDINKFGSGIKASSRKDGEDASAFFLISTEKLVNEGIAKKITMSF